MRKRGRRAAILLGVLLGMPAAALAQHRGRAQRPDPNPDASIVIEQVRVGILAVGASVGGGRLRFRGEEHSFSVRGLEFGSVGVVALSASGEVFQLRRLGPQGTVVAGKLIAFLLLRIGAQIMLTGATDALRPLLAPRGAAVGSLVRHQGAAGRQGRPRAARPAGGVRRGIARAGPRHPGGGMPRRHRRADGLRHPAERARGADRLPADGAAALRRSRQRLPRHQLEEPGADRRHAALPGRTAAHGGRRPGPGSGGGGSGRGGTAWCWPSCWPSRRCSGCSSRTPRRRC